MAGNCRWLHLEHRCRCELSRFWKLRSSIGQVNRGSSFAYRAPSPGIALGGMRLRSPRFISLTFTVVPPKKIIDPVLTAQLEHTLNKVNRFIGHWSLLILRKNIARMEKGIPTEAFVRHADYLVDLLTRCRSRSILHSTVTRGFTCRSRSIRQDFLLIDNRLLR